MRILYWAKVAAATVFLGWCLWIGILALAEWATGRLAAWSICRRKPHASSPQFQAARQEIADALTQGLISPKDAKRMMTDLTDALAAPDAGIGSLLLDYNARERLHQSRPTPMHRRLRHLL